ncbi:hypothetical protein DL769_006389 [Monosporascus sp. CRB-8-3]|nr:hypothetical protein DL769_006389 [Monosporascus sp. CRB-8-3]
MLAVTMSKPSRGYASVTVLDRFDAPFKDSAATDLNKVVRTDYPNQLYTKLGLEAMHVWEDPSEDSIFRGMYRKTGWIMSAPGMARGWLESVREMAERLGNRGVKYMTAEEMRRK